MTKVYVNVNQLTILINISPNTCILLSNGKIVSHRYSRSTCDCFGGTSLASRHEIHNPLNLSCKHYIDKRNDVSLTI